MSRLGVNIDHVATIRQARRISYPDPVQAALLCEEAGCDSMVCHLREDRRHIQDSDLFLLKKRLKVMLNLEMALSPEIIRIALKVKPGQATLVPEKREELTTEGRLDVVLHQKKITAAIRRMEKVGIGVSLFVDPDMPQIKASNESGAGMIELHTGNYAGSRTGREREREFRLLKECARFARGLGMKVFAGHGLNYRNTKPLRSIKEIEEYNIGHSIIARSIFVGLKNAVTEMQRLVA